MNDIVFGEKENEIFEKCMSMLKKSDYEYISSTNIMQIIEEQVNKNILNFKDIYYKIQEVLNWRKNNGYNTLLMQKISSVYSNWDEHVYGIDTNGHTICVIRVNKINMKNISNLSTNTMNLFYAQKHKIYDELNKRSSLEKGTIICKHSIIIDVENIGMNIVNTESRNVIKHLFEFNDYFFPESIKNIFIINAPFAFKIIFSIIKHWISESSSKKIVFVDTNKITETLLAYGFGYNSIPRYLGGTHSGTSIEKVLSICEQNF
jgi:hypothetical protein